MRTITTALIVPLLVLGCARGPNVSSSQLPLSRVVVYRNGVGYFERSGHVDAEQVRFQMRQRMVGDFLASLAIVERGGSSVRSASFPLELDDDEEETPGGPDPRFQSLLKPWPEQPSKPKDPGERLREVVLRLDGKEHDLAIGYVSETPVWRPSYRVVVQAGGKADLQAWGIVQNLSGEDWQDVRLALVAGAPLAFESTLGDPVIPERPIVTDSGEVIAAVPGGVTSLDQQDEGVVDRFGGAESPAEEAEPSDEDAPAPPSSGEGQGAGGLRYKSADKKSKPKGLARADATTATGATSPGAPAPDQKPVPSRTERRRIALEEAKRAGLSAPRRMSALAAVAIEAGTTRYEIPSAVTVPDKSATMVLLLSKSVPGEAVFLFAPDGGVPDSSSHPFRVARFKNATAGLLERGPIAVFEQGSFLGQGLMEPLPPGGTATVPFALERSLAVDSERKYEERGARLNKIELGQLWIDSDRVSKTIYKVKNGGDKPAKLLVRHPRLAGTRLYHPPAGTEDNTGKGNALIPIEVRPRGRAELTVDERQAFPRRVDWLSDAANEAVKAYIKDPRANAGVVAKLQDAWKVRETLKRLTDEQTKLTTEQNELERNADETRASLKAIEKNTQAGDLRAKLTRRLTELSTRMDQITKRLVELRMTINEQEVRFRDAIREVKILSVPPPKD